MGRNGFYRPKMVYHQSGSETRLEYLTEKEVREAITNGLLPETALAQYRTLANEGEVFLNRTTYNNRGTLLKAIPDLLRLAEKYRVTVSPRTVENYRALAARVKKSGKPFI
jgi:hypothetical protein